MRSEGGCDEENKINENMEKRNENERAEEMQDKLDLRMEGIWREAR